MTLVYIDISFVYATTKPKFKLKILYQSSFITVNMIL